MSSMSSWPRDDLSVSVQSTSQSAQLFRQQSSITSPSAKYQPPATPTSAGSARQSDVYLSELLSCSLDRLRKEPDLLREEKEQLERNMQTAAFVQYRAFIDVARCFDTIGQEIDNVGAHLDVILQNAPTLASTCEAFAAESANVMEQYTLNKQLAGGQTVLLELLEVPQLMDTCVRNGIYDEALDLQSFVNRLGLLHPDVPVVKLLLEQVAEVGQTMLLQLLSRLKSNLQLPECLRIMGYLRRIAVFSEEGLRLQFLQCRDSWISNLVDELDPADSYEYVKHLTDIHRLHLFDAVMQYRAIFFDTPSQDNSQQNIRETGMLYSWVQHRVALYLAALETHLPAIGEGGNLASVLENCLYCGSSLSRVGLDFQGLLQPVFEACTTTLFTRQVSAAVDAFNARLEGHKWVPLQAALGARTRDSRAWASQSSFTSTTADGADEDGSSSTPRGSGVQYGGGSDEDLTPPYALMDHLPLAVLTNGLLAAFNTQRHCAMLGCCRAMASTLQSALEGAATSLSHYPHTRLLSDADRPLFVGAVQAMYDVVLPYITLCFSRVFPGVSHRLDTSGAVAVLKKLLVDL